MWSVRLIIFHLKSNIIHSQLSHVRYSREKPKQIKQHRWQFLPKNIHLELQTWWCCGISKALKTAFSLSFSPLILWFVFRQFWHYVQCSNAHHPFPFRLIRNASVNAFHDVRLLCLPNYTIYFILLCVCVHLAVITVVIVAIILLDVSLRQCLCVSLAHTMIVAIT